MFVRLANTTLNHTNRCHSHVGLKYSRTWKAHCVRWISMKYLRYMPFFIVSCLIFFFKRTIAVDLLACYRVQSKKTPTTNCSLHSANNTLFKECLSNLDDEAFDDYMTLFGQIFIICEYYNGTRPIITVDNIITVCLFTSSCCSPNSTTQT